MPEVTICIYGAAGQMGREIEYASTEQPFAEVISLVDREDCIDMLRQMYEPEIQVEPDVANALEDVECLIDFSTAAASEALVEKLLKISAKRKLPALVIGTTGHSKKFEKRLQLLAKKTAIVKSANLSIGVNICYFLVRQAARVVGKYVDFEINETHHRHKLDAPSGTALELGRIICEESGLDLENAAIYDRHGHTGAREEGKIGFSSIRAGGVHGEHRVIFGFDNEVIEVKHTALNRKNFALGALIAARWLTRISDNVAVDPNEMQEITRVPGLYNMVDVLGLKLEI